MPGRSRARLPRVRVMRRTGQSLTARNPRQSLTAQRPRQSLTAQRPRQSLTARNPRQSLTAQRPRQFLRLPRRLAVPLLAAMAAVLAGCGRPQAPAATVKLLNAYVMQPGGSASAAAAFLVIQNLGPADALIAARSSAGGSVRLLSPVKPGSSAIRTVTSVPVPGHAVLRMNPAGLRLLIFGSRQMRTGKDITLTLVFAHAGPVRVLAQVTNAQTGGSSYFGP